MKKGSKHTPESKAKMSAANPGVAFFAGKRHTPESKAKMSAQRTGRKIRRTKPMTPEHRARIAAALEGRTVSDETRARMAESQRRRRDREAEGLAAADAVLAKIKALDEPGATLARHVATTYEFEFDRPGRSGEWQTVTVEIRDTGPSERSPNRYRCTARMGEKVAVGNAADSIEAALLVAHWFELG